MKSVTVREFYHNAGLVDGLSEGRQLVVTAKGKPKFVVTKSARPRMSRALAEERAVGDPRAPVFDGTAFLKSLKPAAGCSNGTPVGVARFSPGGDVAKRVECVELAPALAAPVPLADPTMRRASRTHSKRFAGLGAGVRQNLCGGEPRQAPKLPPLVTVRGGGLTDEFKSVSWNRVRDEIDRRHGA